jgi:RNA polymerase sigma-70 factor, ECF subfamily
MSSPLLLTATDEALIARVQAKDEQAFGVLVARYRDRIYRVALRLIGDEQDAEEALQETFMQVWLHSASFREEARFSTWLYRIATNAALMNRRAQRRHETESLDTCLPQFDAEGQHLRLDVDYSAAARIEAIIEHDELVHRIREALMRLPPIYRVAFTLCDLEDLPAHEAAGIVGVNAATIRQRVHRARLMLRGYLGRLAGSEHQ